MLKKTKLIVFDILFVLVILYSNVISPTPLYHTGTFETTMMIPYLPAHITENELWDIFPLSQEIATYEEKTPR